MATSPKPQTTGEMAGFLAPQRFFPSSITEERRYNKLLEPFGISFQTYNVLGILLLNPDGVEPSKVADEVCILRQTMTNIVDTLQKDGYVERRPHPTDRRRILISLTGEGESFIRRIKEETLRFHRSVMSHFSKGEMEVYFEIRDRITRCMDSELEALLREREGENSAKKSHS